MSQEKLCPQCGSIVGFAPCEYQICKECGWEGSSTELVARFVKEKKVSAIREFEGGATRDSDTEKLDYEGFFSPLVMKRYAEYMHKHRIQTNGEIRDSDNWQRGIPFASYMKSGWRHFMDWWLLHRGSPFEITIEEFDEKLEEALCAIIFNASGYLHEHLHGELK